MENPMQSYIKIEYARKSSMDNRLVELSKNQQPNHQNTDIFPTKTIFGCKSQRNAPEKHFEKRSGGINALFAPSNIANR